MKYIDSFKRVKDQIKVTILRERGSKEEER
ncbi:hypothetical protein C5S32_00920 [ANME-1 cluster archaeon GoMg1]|nr:hypothetical protein [ANME-1 cluster archaeon GoMg1]